MIDSTQRDFIHQHKQIEIFYEAIFVVRNVVGSLKANLDQRYFIGHSDIYEYQKQQYFKKISESDLLILASNFDKPSIEYYKYSWPAKMGSYLMSKVPIFIFGPPNVFFVNDAIKRSWAYVESSN